MFFKLHDRRAQGLGRPRGLSCDDTGLHFAGECALIERVQLEEGWIYRVRPIEDINRSLSAGYGAAVDLAPRNTALESIADHLNRGEVGFAQLIALKLHLRDLADDDDVDRLLKADRLLRYNHNHDERGRFASEPGAAQAVNHYASPRGVRFSTALRLNATQSALAGKIIDYGDSHGFRPDQIVVAVSQAFYESSLGLLRQNLTNSDAIGIFQYESQAWHDLLHSNLNRFDDNDQIIAIFLDISHYEKRFEDGKNSGSIPNYITFPIYFAIKHHAGPSAHNWHISWAQEYSERAAALDFTLQH